MQQGLELCRSTAGARLIDVREADEYAQGHIPGSENLPLSAIASATDRLQERESAIFVYCLSGARSRQAAQLLKGMGYRNVTDLGGIRSYRGPVER